jgi:hypothetical protein
MANDKHEESFVTPRGDEWLVKKPHAERVSGVFETKAEALQRARELAGRGEIHVQNKNGKFTK